ncbi:hypothetical protein R5R35_004766 [Gryllus longicercus]|uniref:Complex III assembly factor LYRM7 n=1 Tax=Gryllus longicercus TaxID=2509291 RepID=A0AAN9WGA5_9ORTH
MDILRRQVLNAFKDLHKARKIVFSGDSYALEGARQKINAEFKKNKHIKDPLAIQEMVVLSKSVEKELRTSVVQAEEISPGTYRLKITPETKKLDNVPFKDCGS